jgi:hypothetical protein
MAVVILVAEQIISTNANGTIDVYAIDLDGDGDNDVLSASYLDNKIAWYINDGNGNFSTEQIISTNANGATSVYAIDLDGDGDNDVLSASRYDDKIAWYFNGKQQSKGNLLYWLTSNHHLLPPTTNRLQRRTAPNRHY